MFKHEVPNALIHNTPPPLIEVSGSHHEMGRQIGEAARVQVQNSVSNAHILIEAAYNALELTWDGAKIQARKYLPFAEERYPQYVDELRGIAELYHSADIGGMYANVSETARFGGLKNGKRIIDSHVSQNMEKVLDELESGSFMSEFEKESQSGFAWTKKALDAEKSEDINRTGARIRSRFRL